MANNASADAPAAVRKQEVSVPQQEVSPESSLSETLKEDGSGDSAVVTPEQSSPHNEQQYVDIMGDISAAANELTSVASGWLSGWVKSLATAKDKSVEVLDLVKKDIVEVSQAVQSETSSLLTSTSHALRDQLRLEDDSSTASQVTKSVSGFLTHVQKAFTPDDTIDDDETETYVMRDGKPVLLDRLQAELYRLVQDRGTFTSDPSGGGENRFSAWCNEHAADLEARQPELSDQLASNRQLLDQYTQLVPAHVTHQLFWHRYLYRIHLTEEADRKREERRQRVEKLANSGPSTSDHHDQIVWEEEDFSDHVQVTDAQAERVLAEYDNEVRGKQKKVQKPATPGRADCDSPGQDSSSHEDEWVKDDLDTADTASSVTDTDWEKCGD